MRNKEFKYILLILIATIVFSACRPAEVVTPPPPRKLSPTPMPPPAVRVEKPVNVSFSTYSKDWPLHWQWIDPDDKANPAQYDVKTGSLRIRVQSGKDLYGENRTAPRFVKPLIGDFQIETRVKFLPKENYQGAGLLIYQDGDNYIRFERAYGGVGGGGEGIRLDVRRGEIYTPITTPNDIQTDSETVDLKLVRDGHKVYAYWRPDEESGWRVAGEVETDYPDTIMAGVMVCNTAREVTAEFGYIHLLPPVGH